MKIDGKTMVLGVIGDPIEHTLSPVIHNTLVWARTGYQDSSDAVYTAFHVNSEGLGSAVRGAYELGIGGMNVTVPHKSEVMKYLSSIDPVAEAIGAVNTLVREEGGYRGYNTDTEGFVRELEFYNIDVSGQTVVMLGAGGASKAVAFGIASKKPERIYILNRTIQKAEQIAESVNAYYGSDVAVALTYDMADSIEAESYIAVQCTSVGLAPKCDECVIDDAGFYDKVSVGVDIIYKPTETRFMEYIRERGKPAYNGLRMLLYQGIAAHEKFCAVSISQKDTEVAARALEAAAGIKKPIILVGYMGSGKTTISRILSALFYTTVKDTDEMIVREYGRSINDIFEKDGEEVFRDMETELIRELVSQGEDMYILSCGGGMILREENRRLLKTLGTVIYLKAQPETIYKRVKGDDSRPLLAGDNLMDKIIRMLDERGALYEDAAGIVITSDGKSPERVAEEIRRMLV